MKDLSLVHLFSQVKLSLCRIVQSPEMMEKEKMDSITKETHSIEVLEYRLLTMFRSLMNKKISQFKELFNN